MWYQMHPLQQQILDFFVLHCGFDREKSQDELVELAQHVLGIGRRQESSNTLLAAGVHILDRLQLWHGDLHLFGKLGDALPSDVGLLLPHQGIPLLLSRRELVKLFLGKFRHPSYGLQLSVASFGHFDRIVSVPPFGAFSLQGRSRSIWDWSLGRLWAVDWHIAIGGIGWGCPGAVRGAGAEF